MKKYGVCYHVGDDFYFIYHMEGIADYTDTGKYILVDELKGLCHRKAEAECIKLNKRVNQVKNKYFVFYDERYARLTEKTIMLNSTTDRTGLINDRISTHSHHAYIEFDSYKPYFNAVGIDEHTKLTIMFPNDNKGYMIITQWVSDMVDYLLDKMGSTENVQNNVTIYFNEKYVGEFPYIEFFKNVKYY